MAKLVVDTISARSLPFLDNLIQEGKADEIIDKLMYSPVAALRRLFLASIARHTVPAGDESPASASGEFVEDLIRENQAGRGETVEDLIGDDWDQSALTMLIVISLVRYSILEGTSV